MKAVLPGAGEGLEGRLRPGEGPRLGELPEPHPGPGEVTIAVRATAVNRADLLQIRGRYPPPPGETDVPGLECSGVVERLGAGVDGWRAGDRVMALLAGGGHGEKVAAPAGQLMPLPERLSFEEGAALPESCLTAWTNLVVEGGLDPVPGEDGGGGRPTTVLVTGANGGVGTVAVQLARELGAGVLAAGRSMDRLELLEELGAHHLVIDGEGLPGAVRDLTRGRGADLVLDLVGGDLLESHLAALRNRGRLVLVGLMAGSRPRVDLAEVLRRRLTIVGSVLRARSREEKAELVAGFSSFATARLADGRIRPVVHRVIPFDRIADAYRSLEEGGVFGKVVVSLG